MGREQNEGVVRITDRHWTLQQDRVALEAEVHVRKVAVL